jgi:hypothetical protein
MADPFAPFAGPNHHVRIEARLREIKALLDGAEILPDAVTISALILLLHDAAEMRGMPLVMVITALAALDGARLTVTALPDDGDEEEQLIGGKPN